ncbi:MAG: ComEC/Rec2 family competence protein [Epsilonproteobacteria bacterium]|nr:ComEC/Rec2 family competence protein [Campylobacterota bacterium]
MIERVELLQKPKEWFFLFFVFLLLLSFSLLWEYYNYKQLVKFDSALVNAKVLNQYTKTKTTPSGKTKHYQILKLKADDGFTFYTLAKKDLSDIIAKQISLEIFTGKEGNISFLDYLKGFFAPSKILKIDNSQNLWHLLQNAIASQHQDANITRIYEALYLAKPLPKDLLQTFSTLGISHLIAISGFHLGVLSFVLLLLLKYPYKFLQSRYFPYRSFQRDTFILIALALLLYTIFLDAQPSLLRSFVMFVIGFFLYDRGIKIISMQTLLITILVILTLFPRLVFALGFWLSVAGVFYIFLFLHHFQSKKFLWQFLMLPLFVYLMMLPYSTVIFGNFSLLHPLSTLYTTLFSLFYPLSIALHLMGMGDLLDGVLLTLIQSAKDSSIWLELPNYLLVGFVFASLLAIFSRLFFYLLIVFASLFCVSLIYYAA